MNASSCTSSLARQVGARLAERTSEGMGICKKRYGQVPGHCCGTPEELAARIVHAWIRGGALAAIADSLNYDGYARTGGND
jgi:hypothetical protein